MRGKGIICFKGLVILLTALVLQGTNGASAEELTVMTRNLYLGADLAPALAAQNQEQFFAAVEQILETIGNNNFPERAEALAAEIVEKKPHLVGLQEAYNFTINGTNPGPPFNNSLQVLLAALAAQGADYRVAAEVKNVDLAFLYDSNMIGVLDRDVILARGDVFTEVVDRDGLCQVSEDGCNYQVIAQVPNPIAPELPPLAIERGLLAVDASVGNLSVRFVNTHLEERDLGPFGYFQAQQAFELTQILTALNSESGAPIVVVGDFNSDPRDPDPEGPIVPPYKQLTDAGFVDAWTLRPGRPDGFTCCQEEDLANHKSDLYERIDLIFSSETPAEVKANTVGNDQADKRPSGLWPSDHAGVVGRMEFAP